MAKRRFTDTGPQCVTFWGLVQANIWVVWAWLLLVLILCGGCAGRNVHTSCDTDAHCALVYGGEY